MREGQGFTWSNGFDTLDDGGKISDIFQHNKKNDFYLYY